MRTACLPRLGIVVVAGVLVLTACGDDGAGVRVTTPAATHSVSAGPLASTPAGAEGLDPCPPSTAGQASEGGLPDVTLQCLGDGPAVRLAGLRGEPRLVNVWASWCPPCRAEMPWLQDAYAAGIDVLGVDAEDLPDAAGALVGELGIRYPSVFDPDNELGRAVGVTSKPITLFVSADGEVVHTQIGAFDSPERLRTLVAEQLGVTLR